MPTLQERHFLPYSAMQLFVLVLDIEKYPEFLPWCRAARILERRDDAMLAELMIHFAPVSERYTSRVRWHEAQSIDVELVEGPFHHLTNRWRFTPAEGGTEVDFFLDFAFKSKLLEKMIGGYFTKAAKKMTAAFTTRAEAMYSESFQRNKIS